MYLGLDLGTSGLRALLVDEGGIPVVSAEQSYPLEHPHQGWSEQNPQDWIKACSRAITDIRSSHPKEFAALKGIGIAGQMHGATLLGNSGDVLRACILWNDTRSHLEAAKLDAIPAFRAISGNIVFPGFTAPKLVWVARHEPEIFARIAKVLLPKDYLNHWLTGRYISDMSDASGTSWLSVGKRCWSEELLALSGMLSSQMPELVEGYEVAGTLRKKIAQEWGVSPAVIVVGGGGDNAVAACGVGAVNEGDGFVSLGTSGVILAAKDSFAPDADCAVHTFCHAIPNRWYQMGVNLAATDSLNWLASLVGQTPQALTTALGGTIRGPGLARFLPYLSGERTPHNDSSIRGAMTGLDIATDAAGITQAVLEGVSFALRDSLEALRSTGTGLDRLLAIGGGTQSPYWVELLATILNLPIELPEAGEFGAALGAGRLAICGANGTDPYRIMGKPAIASTVEPRTDLTEAYAASYEKFRASYSAIKAIQ